MPCRSEEVPAGRRDRGAVLALRGPAAGGGGCVLLRLRDGRAPDPGPALRGRPGEEVAPALGRVATDGGRAAAIAGLAALEAARGSAPDPATAAARALLLLGEVAVAFVRRASLDWPRLAGVAPPGPCCLPYACTALSTLAARMWRLADPLEPAARAQAGLAAEPAASALIEALERAVLPRAPADPARLAAWAARDPAPLARLIRGEGRGRARAGEGRGAAPLPVAPPPGPLAEVAMRLAAEPGFARAPCAPGGGPADPGPVACLSPPLAAAAAGFGPVGGRLFAQAARAQAVIEALAGLAAPPVEALALAPGLGAARAEGPRGPVIVTLALDRAGRVAELRLLEPVDWLLHPAGPFAAALAALPEPCPPGALGMLLAAFDPGLPVRLLPGASAAAGRAGGAPAEDGRAP